MLYHPTDVLIGSKLRELRQAKKYSIRYVGDKIGRSNVTVHYYETGRNAVDIPTLKRLCELYGTDIIKFLDEILDKI